MMWPVIIFLIGSVFWFVFWLWIATKAYSVLGGMLSFSVATIPFILILIHILDILHWLFVDP
jgi:hypothetical protein